MADRYYLTMDDVKFIHAEQLRLYGGSEGIRDEGLILSALLRPQTGYYADLIEEAAALWESLAMNHGFVDGSKRVAFESTLIFLEANGVRVAADQDETTAFILGNLENGTFSKDMLDAWLRENAQPVGAE